MSVGIGVAPGASWIALRGSFNAQPADARKPPAANTDEQEWKLTSELVSRALQTRTISTRRLRRNSNDEVVWRWLKQSIAEYPQNFVVLNISEAEHSYFVTLRTPGGLNQDYVNGHLKELGRPLLDPRKRYAELIVNQEGLGCPDWYGLIDLESPKLIYFEGRSG